MPKGVEIEDLRVGEGPEATRSSVVKVVYDLYLHQGDRVQSGVQCEIRMGAREVIAGLRYGVEGMRAGGRRRFRVSPHLAYGERGLTGVVPANALLIFEVELLQVTPEEPRSWRS